MYTSHRADERRAYHALVRDIIDFFVIYVLVYIYIYIHTYIYVYTYKCIPVIVQTKEGKSCAEVDANITLQAEFLKSQLTDHFTV